jgi:hypothetical protein
LVDATFEAAQRFVVQRLLNDEARAGATDVSLVEEDAIDDAFDGLVDRSVLEDDVGPLASQLQRQSGAVGSEDPLDLATDVRRAGKGHFVNSGVTRR